MLKLRIKGSHRNKKRHESPLKLPKQKDLRTKELLLKNNKNLRRPKTLLIKKLRKQKKLQHPHLKPKRRKQLI